MRLLRLAAASLFFVSVEATATVVAPPQAHDPRECGQSASCVHAWFVEWRDGMIAEFRFWRGLESAVIGDPSNAVAAANTATARQMYRHRVWEIYRGEPPAGALPQSEFDAAFDCRMAVIDLKYMFATRSAGHAPPPDDISAYLKAATSCEKAFHIPPVASPLR